MSKSLHVGMWLGNELRHQLTTKKGVFSKRVQKDEGRQSIKSPLKSSLKSPLKSVHSNFGTVSNFNKSSPGKHSNLCRGLGFPSPMPERSILSEETTSVHIDLQGMGMTNHEYRVQEKLRMLRDEDESGSPMKGLGTSSTLLKDMNVESPTRRVLHAPSRLQPVAGYTSTNEKVYNEVLERRQIRQ